MILFIAMVLRDNCQRIKYELNIVTSRCIMITLLRGASEIYFLEMRSLQPKMNKDDLQSKAGVYYALAAFTLWGFLPLFWKLLSAFSAGEILANRMIWSAVFVFLLLKKRKQLNDVKQIFKQPKKLGLVILSAIIISANWFIYIWAVNSNHVLETSMGYYINPLIVILMGTLLLKEKLNRLEIIAILFAAAGVMIMTLQYGRIPWVSLALAISFSLYGLCKKMVKIDSLVALGVETLLLSPFALLYLIVSRTSFLSTVSAVSPATVLLLTMTGIFTALPLLWFAQAAKRVTLSVLGFSQYLSPTITLMLGIFLFREPFTITHLLSFGSIWMGLLVFSYVQTMKLKALNKLKRNQ